MVVDMHVTAYLNFDGRCEEAFRFYERCLGGKIEVMMTFGESPMAGELAAQSGTKILHASMTVKGMWLMGGDVPDGRYEKPQGFAVMLGMSDAAEAERVFGELAEGGAVTLGLQETFWAARFGMVTDRFGTPWMVNCAGAAG